MDHNSCKTAVIIKDACEAYAGCYYPKVKVFKDFVRRTRYMEMDRKAEWRGLKRMDCLIDAFADGKVTNKEVDVCKKQSHSTKFEHRVPPSPTSQEVCHSRSVSFHRRIQEGRV
jgi:hypothetical protein